MEAELPNYQIHYPFNPWTPQSKWCQPPPPKHLELPKYGPHKGANGTFPFVPFFEFCSFFLKMWHTAYGLFWAYFGTDWVWLSFWDRERLIGELRHGGKIALNLTTVYTCSLTQDSWICGWICLPEFRGNVPEIPGCVAEIPGIVREIRGIALEMSRMIQPGRVHGSFMFF